MSNDALIGSAKALTKFSASIAMLVFVLLDNFPNLHTISHCVIVKYRH